MGSTSIYTALIFNMWTENTVAYRSFAQSSQLKWPKQSTPTFLKAVEARNRSSGRSPISGVIVYAVQYICFWLNLRRFVCLGSTNFAEQCVYSSEPGFDCSFVHFARKIWPVEVSSIALWDALHRIPVDFLSLARKSCSWSRKGKNYRIFEFLFQLLEIFISSPNCFCCSNLKMIAFAFSLSSTLTTSVAGLYLLNALFAFATVFTSLLMLPNRFHLIRAFVSSAFIMKTDE